MGNDVVCTVFESLVKCLNDESKRRYKTLTQSLPLKVYEADMEGVSGGYTLSGCPGQYSKAEPVRSNDTDVYDCKKYLKSGIVIQADAPATLKYHILFHELGHHYLARKNKRICFNDGGFLENYPAALQLPEELNAYWFQHHAINTDSNNRDQHALLQFLNLFRTTVRTAEIIAKQDDAYTHALAKLYAVYTPIMQQPLDEVEITDYFNLSTAPARLYQSIVTNNRPKKARGILYEYARKKTKIDDEYIKSTLPIKAFKPDQLSIPNKAPSGTTHFKRSKTQKHTRARKRMADKLPG